MSNFSLRLVVDNAWDDAVADADSASTEPMAMPITNTQDALGCLREFPLRTADTSVLTVTGVFPAKSIALVAINHANFTQSATVAVTLKLATATVATFSITANGTACWQKWITAVEADEISIVITDASNPAGYHQFVQLILGPSVTVTYNFNLGMKFKWDQDVEHIRTAGRSLRSEGTRLMTRQAVLDLSYLSDADRETLIDALHLYGMAVPLFLSLYPEWGGRRETDHQFVAKLAAPVEHVHVTQTMWDQGGVEFLEC